MDGKNLARTMLKICLVLFTISVINAQNFVSEDVKSLPTICTHKVNKRCGLSMCSEVTQLECFHGHCNNMTGECECSNCWSGESCNIPENLHLPEFKQKKLEVTYKGESNHVATLKASDRDAERCLDQDCHCSDIVYAIEEGNDDTMFQIDSFTGVITFSQDIPQDVGNLMRTLMISAKNPVHGSRQARSADADPVSTMEVIVTGHQVHSRKKRSSPSSMPTNPTFLLEKLDSFTGITELSIGTKVPMRLSIWLPDNTYDMHVELLTPYESSAIMVVSNVVITHVGSNFDDSLAQTSIEMDAFAGDYRWDRAVINFGSVSNSGIDSADADQSKIVIEYDVVMVDNNATQAGVTYMVSAGVAYDTEIWIGQVAFTATLDRDSWTTESPAISISGPSELYKDTSALLVVDMIVREYASDIRLDVMTESETEVIMSVCSMSIASYGSSYDYLPKELPQFESITNVSSGFNATASYNFGKITNAEKRARGGNNDDTADVITVQIALYLSNSSEIVDQKQYKIGISVTVNEEIHSNQFSVTALTADSVTLATEPNLNFFAAGGNNVVIGGHVGLILSITLAEVSTTDIVVELSMPTDTPAFSICSAQVYHIGHNYPCLTTMVPTEFNQNDGTNTDNVQLNLGKVTNVGRRSETSDSTIKIRIVANVLPTVTDSTTHMVTGSVKYMKLDEEIIWVAQVSLTAVTVLQTTQEAPTIELFNRANDYYIYKNSGLSFNIDLTVPPSTSFTPFSLNLAVPESSDESLFSVCYVSPSTIGGSFSCYEADNFTIVEDELNAQSLVTITLEPFTNPVFENDVSDDNKVTTEVHLKLKDHPDIQDGDEYNISVTLTYGQETVTKVISYEVSYTDPEYTEDNEEPQFELELDDGRVSALLVGETAVYTMIIYTPINSITKYNIDVVAENNTVSVCRADILTYGSNVPCLSTAESPIYLSLEEDGLVDRGILDLGIVRNSGIGTTVVGSDNFITVQVVVKLDEQIDIPQPFDVTVTTGHSDMWSTTRNITFNTGSRAVTYDDLDPIISFAKKTSDTSIAKGASAAYNMDVYIPFKSLKSYKLDVTGVSKSATVCEARIISSGWNIPCVNGSMLTTIYNTTVVDAYDDTATLDAGVITNMEWTNDQFQTTPNMVRFQIVFRVEPDTTASDGDSVSVSANLFVDGVGTNEPLSFNVADSFTTELQPTYAVHGPHENHTDPDTNAAVYTVGQKQNFTFNITTEVMTTNVRITMDLPDDTDEMILTVTNVTLRSIGHSYGCYRIFEPIISYASAYDTSQKDSVDIQLGVITNIGTSHYYQYKEHEPDDDAIILDVEIQLADHYNLVDGQTYDFTVSFTDSVGTEDITKSVEALVTGDEFPDLEYLVSMPEYDPMDLNPGDFLRIESTIQHSNTSSAHAYNVFINLMLPYYILLDDRLDVEGLESSIQTSSDGEQIHFEKMFFTDVVDVNFNFSIDPAHKMPMGLGIINTTIPVEVIYYKRNGFDGSNNVILGQVYKTQTIVLSVPFTVPECNNSLGMESGAIQSCQITASSWYQNQTPDKARPGGEKWKAGIRNLENEYIQVRFGWLHRISAIKDFDNQHTQFTVSYTTDFVQWHDYMELSEIKVFEPTYNNTLMNPFDAIAVRLKVIDAIDTDKSLSFELYGCERAQALDQSAACPDPAPPDFGQYDRGVIVDPVSGRIFVCVLEDIDKPKRCSYSDDNGVSWGDIDDNIGNIIAIMNTTREIYGVAQNEHVLMRSDDYGTTWFTVSPDSYNQYRDDNMLMTMAQEIPNDMADENLQLDLTFTSITNEDQSLKIDQAGLLAKDSDGNWQRIGYWT